jgi:MFS family permease
MGLVDRFLVNRDYARLWYGQAISTLGDFVFNTTLVLWIAAVLANGKPWAPTAVSGVLVSFAAAVLIVGPFAGVFVDRWDRRATMLSTEVVRGALVGLLTVVSFLPARDLPVWAWLAMIYAIVFVLNSAGQFFGPARFATIGDIVAGESDRARAAGIGQATSATAAIIGPPLAAPLLFGVGLQWALLFNALSYVVSFVAIRSVRIPAVAAPERPAGRRPPVRKEFAAGLRFFAGSRFLVALLVIAVICQSGTGALNALNVFFVTGNLHAPARMYGYLGTALGVGGIVGALAAGRVVRWVGARAAVWAGLFAGGALIVAYSRQTVFLAGLILLFAISIPVTLLNTAMSPLMLAAAPREYMGRVMAVLGPAVQLASMLSVVLAGWLASSALRTVHGSFAGMRFGPIDTIFAASGLLVLVAGGYALAGLPRPAGQPATESAQEVEAAPG